MQKFNFVFFLEISDYCVEEDFTAICGHDEVVIIDTAKYGRMALGRCIKRNYGYIGCAADYQALEFMDSKCSGRRQCSLNVFDSGIRSLQPCPDDLAAYLETSYSCIKGITHAVQYVNSTWINLDLEIF